MPPLYVVQQGAKIRCLNRRIRIEKEEPGIENGVLADVPLVHVSEIVLFGNIGITTPAIGYLLDENIPVTFLTGSGEFRGQLTGPVNPNVPVRRAQYNCLNNPVFVLEMASSFVKAKLEHQKALLQRHNKDMQDLAVEAAVLRLKTTRQDVERKTCLSSLRGVEGSSTAAYFSGFRKLLKGDWEFTNRVRRPPPDPVNVLLSLGYTLLSRITAAAVQSAGLDVHTGFLHEYAYNRPSLALDLMEEFRPVVDGLVLWCCNSKVLLKEHFISQPGNPDLPVLLTEDGKKFFLKAFNERMETGFTHPVRNMKMELRQCIIEQARQVVHCVTSGKVDFRPMGFR